MQLKKISEQTIVITGATSGIGLVTARQAAKQGAKVVLVARNEDALHELAAEINGDGANGVRALAIALDVADEDALHQVAHRARETFGGFDTWVNNAGVSIYGKIAEIPTDEMRRLFETNFWGLVFGSRIAAIHLGETGGAIINVGSILSDRAIAYQGIYSASKHAVKGFTDALRMELEAEKLPVAVTLIKPSAINTPYAEHARNYFPKEASLPPPIFAPDLVAEAILHCAQTPTRDFTVGEGKMLASMGEFAPRMTDKVMEWGMAQQQFKNEPATANAAGTLYESRSNLTERGQAAGIVFEESLYQRAKLNPWVTAAIFVGGGIALATLLRRNRDKAVTSAEFSENHLYLTEEERFVRSSQQHTPEVANQPESQQMQLGHS